MKFQQLLLVMFVLFCACSKVKHPNATKMSLLYFSYVPKEHAIYGREGTYEVLIENLTADTIVWKNKIETEQQFEINRQEAIRILPKEKVIKRVNVYMNDEQLNALLKGIPPKLFAIRGKEKYELPKHRFFAICNKVKEQPCSERRKLEILKYRQF